MSDLATHEAAAVFAALDPLFKPNSRGQYRGPANYRGGDNPKALSIDLSRGGRYFDHVAGQGGDVVDYVKAALNTDFHGARRVIEGITGRPIGAATDRKPRFSRETLIKAERFQIGLLWRIDRHLEVLKAELWRQLDAS